MTFDNLRSEILNPRLAFTGSSELDAYTKIIKPFIASRRATDLVKNMILLVNNNTVVFKIDPNTAAITLREDFASMSNSFYSQSLTLEVISNVLISQAPVNEKLAKIAQLVEGKTGNIDISLLNNVKLDTPVAVKEVAAEVDNTLITSLVEDNDRLKDKIASLEKKVSSSVNSNVDTDTLRNTIKVLEEKLQKSATLESLDSMETLSKQQFAKVLSYIQTQSSQIKGLTQQIDALSFKLDSLNKNAPVLDFEDDFSLSLSLTPEVTTKLETDFQSNVKDSNSTF